MSSLTIGSSSTAEFAIRELDTYVFQEDFNVSYGSNAGVDILLIRFQFFDRIFRYNLSLGDYEYEEVPKGRYTLELPISRKKAVPWSLWKRTERLAKYKRVITKSPRERYMLINNLKKHIYMTGATSEEAPAIIHKILEMLEAAVPDKIIDVQIVENIVRFRDHELELLEEDSESYRPKLIPATEAFIQGLETVEDIDCSIELSCAICLEGVTSSQGGGGGGITRLPKCLHFFHRKCIHEWLNMNHICPLCRNTYPHD